MEVTPKSSLPIVSESQYILAKYQIKPKTPITTIQAIEPSPSDLHPDHDYHPGPEALKYDANAGQFGCNLDSCTQIAWCLFLPFYAIKQCFVGCVDGCCDKLATWNTRLEESYTMSCCLSGCPCCKLQLS